jgi:hypothetical protein
MIDRELLEHALLGYEQHRGEVLQKIAELRTAIFNAGQPPQQAVVAEKLRKRPYRRRQMSPEGRARIAAATKKRWAEYHRKHAPRAKR